MKMRFRADALRTKGFEPNKLDLRSIDYLCRDINLFHFLTLLFLSKFMLTLSMHISFLSSISNKENKFGDKAFYSVQLFIT